MLNPSQGRHFVWFFDLWKYFCWGKRINLETIFLFTPSFPLPFLSLSTSPKSKQYHGNSNNPFPLGQPHRGSGQIRWQWVWGGFECTNYYKKRKHQNTKGKQMLQTACKHWPSCYLPQRAEPEIRYFEIVFAAQKQVLWLHRKPKIQFNFHTFLWGEVVKQDNFIYSYLQISMVNPSAMAIIYSID